MNYYQNLLKFSQNFLKISQQFVFFVQTREKLTHGFIHAQGDAGKIRLKIEKRGKK